MESLLREDSRKRRFGDDGEHQEFRASGRSAGRSCGDVEEAALGCICLELRGELEG